MARFRGTVEGGRGEASRLGHASSGLTTRAVSHKGAVRVSLRAVKDEDFALIEVRGATIYYGEVNRDDIHLHVARHQLKRLNMQELAALFDELAKMVVLAHTDHIEEAQEED